MWPFADGSCARWHLPTQSSIAEVKSPSFLVVSKAPQRVDSLLELVPTFDVATECLPSAEMMICVTAIWVQAKPHIDTWNDFGCSHDSSLTWLCMSPETVCFELSVLRLKSRRVE